RLSGGCQLNVVLNVESSAPGCARRGVMSARQTEVPTNKMKSLCIRPSGCDSKLVLNTPRPRLIPVDSVVIHLDGPTASSLARHTNKDPRAQFYLQFSGSKYGVHPSHQRIGLLGYLCQLALGFAHNTANHRAGLSR